MADLSDVENAVVVEVTDALYPQGISQASIVGTTCRVYRGWPITASLNTDLAAGVVNVAIFPANKPDEVSDPYFDHSYTTISPTSLIASVTGQSVTFSGLVATGQVVGLLIDGVPFSYVVNASDTSQSIAANLAVLINVTRVVSVSDSTITVPAVGSLIARAVTKATLSQALRRQRRGIDVSCWCPSATLRDSVCQTVDIALTSSPFIPLADETMAHVRYISTQVYDQSQNALLYRRDLCYLFEYTSISQTFAPVMLFGDFFRNGNGSYV